MVLIVLAVEAGMHHGTVGKELQVLAHATLGKPHRRVEPEQAAQQLADHHIQRMPLAHVGLLVRQDFLQLPFAVIAGLHEYPAEKGERHVIPLHGKDAHPVPLHPLPPPCQTADHRQLHQHAQQQGGSPRCPEQRQAVLPGPRCRLLRGNGRHHHRHRLRIVRHHHLQGRLRPAPHPQFHQRVKESQHPRRPPIQAAHSQKSVPRQQTAVKQVKNQQPHIDLQDIHIKRLHNLAFFN